MCPLAMLRMILSFWSHHWMSSFQETECSATENSNKDPTVHEMSRKIMQSLSDACLSLYPLSLHPIHKKHKRPVCRPLRMLALCPEDHHNLGGSV